MKRIDFLKELNEIDDDLLLDAELPLKREKHIPFKKIGVQAALIVLVLCLIPATVLAVTIGVRILVSQEEIPNYSDYLMGGFLHIDSKVTTIEYELAPHPIDVPLQWEEKLTDAWKGFPYDHSNFTGIDLKDAEGRRMNFGSISDVEKLLGTSLTSSQELEQITQGVYVTLAITDPERAAAQLRTEGIVSPDGILVYLPFRNHKETGLDPDVVDYCGLRVFIPLTEAFAERYAEHAVLSGVDQQEFDQSRFYSSGNVEVILLENHWQDEYDTPRGYAAWEKDGIGYLVELKNMPDAKESPVELLRPYLENLEG
jgi:hypothetical protein